jgi:hypothetical protein
MKWVRICALIVITLSAMRAMSWTLGWVLSRLSALRVSGIAGCSNAAAFAVFVLFLYRTLVPGEAIDVDALLFGAVVFAVFGLTDLYWVPWKQRR